MRYKKLCKGGPEVSIVSFGAWGISGRDWGVTDDSTSLKALHTALDNGINLIDTADVYGFGHSDELIRKVLEERKSDNIFVATKAGSDFYNFTNEKREIQITPNYKKEYLIEAVEKSLKRLNVETLDLLQLHSPASPLLKKDDAWEALHQLKKSGKIRFAGLSVKSFAENEQTPFVEQYNEVIDVLQVRYNLLEREAEENLFPASMKYEIGVLARIPLLFGFLSGKFNQQSKFGENDHRKFNLSPEKLRSYLVKLEHYEEFFKKHSIYTKAQLSLAFILSNPAVTCVIPGAKTPKQVMDNIKAAEIPSEIFEELK